MYPEFVFYYLSLIDFNFYNEGTTIPSLRTQTLNQIEVLIPNKEEQLKMLNLINPIVRKIEMNTQINETLEEMAEAIFKHWFIEFEFPNENGEPYKSSGGNVVESELGMIPEEWAICKIEDICDVSSSRRVFLKDYVTKGIPFYRSKEIIEKRNGNIISTELFISKSHYKQLKEKHGVPNKGDILLTSVGTLGIPYLVGDEEFYFKDGNLTWFKNFQRTGFNLYLYYWLLSNEGQTNLEYITIGSTQKALTITALRNIEILFPNDDIINRFLDVFGGINKLIVDNVTQNSVLSSIRDTLLPKLMSGEIRIPDAEKEIEACLQKNS